jgi:hypothetical protein
VVKEAGFRSQTGKIWAYEKMKRNATIEFVVEELAKLTPEQITALNREALPLNEGRRKLIDPRNILSKKKHSHRASTYRQPFIGFIESDDDYWQSAPEEAILMPIHFSRV